MGGWRRARCRWRPDETIGMARHFRAARWWDSARPRCTDVVKYEEEMKAAITVAILICINAGPLTTEAMFTTPDCK
jgi:hypothetical protein